jgi:hypothetical protein
MSTATLNEATPADIEVALWDLDAIARYYGRSIRTARRITQQPGFPPPANGDRRRWPARHVIAWAVGTWTPDVVQVEKDGTLAQRTKPGQRIERKRVWS